MKKLKKILSWGITVASLMVVLVGMPVDVFANPGLTRPFDFHVELNAKFVEPDGSNITDLDLTAERWRADYNNVTMETNVQLGTGPDTIPFNSSLNHYHLSGKFVHNNLSGWGRYAASRTSVRGISLYYKNLTINNKAYVKTVVPIQKLYTDYLWGWPYTSAVGTAPKIMSRNNNIDSEPMSYDRSSGGKIIFK